MLNCKVMMKTRISIKRLTKAITAARPQVQVELVSWSAATFVAISQAGAGMVTAMIHHCTRVLSYSQEMRGKMNQNSSKLLTANRLSVLHLYTFSHQD